MADESMSNVDPDTSRSATAATTAFVDYASSPRIRQRRHVTWTTPEETTVRSVDESPSKRQKKKKKTAGDPSSSMIIEELDLSPSMARRRRRRRRDRLSDERELSAISDDPEVLLPVSQDAARNCDVGVGDDTGKNASAAKRQKSPGMARAVDEDGRVSEYRMLLAETPSEVFNKYQDEALIKDDSQVSTSPTDSSLSQKRHRRRRKTTSPDDPTTACPNPQLTDDATRGYATATTTEHPTAEPSSTMTTTESLGGFAPRSTQRDALVDRAPHDVASAATSARCRGRLPLNTSVWMGCSLGLLMMSNVLFFVAFVTPSWGIVRISTPASQNAHQVSGTASRGDAVSALRGTSPSSPSTTWNFGLWRCCRDDGLCLGTRWPAFYSATRTFAVLALFGHALSFALIFGHTVEKLLDYDPCTMLTLVSSCFVTVAFVVIAVAVYGAVWPTSFHQMLSSSNLADSTTDLGYSFFLAAVSAPLTTASGVLALVDLRSSHKAYVVRRTFADVFDDDDDDDDVVDDVTDVRSDFDSSVAPDGVLTEGIGIERNCLEYLDRSSLWYEDSLR